MKDNSHQCKTQGPVMAIVVNMNTKQSNIYKLQL